MINYSIEKLMWLACLPGIAMLITGSTVKAAPSLADFSFKASHNAYERNEPIYEQIDGYNSWCVELDISRDTDDSIEVLHACADNGTEFEDELDETFLSQALVDGLLFLYLDMKQFSSCNKNWGPASWYIPKIHDEVVAALGRAGRPSIVLYTPVDFRSDGSVWGSVKDLANRGFHLVVIIDEIDAYASESNLVFTSTTSIALANFYAPDTCVLINREKASFPGEERSWDDNKHLWRSWRAPDDTTITEHGHWDLALANGFNFIATTKISDTWTNTFDVHSPFPVYVDLNWSGGWWGTYSQPDMVLQIGIARADPGVTVRIAAGTYTLSQSGGYNRIDKELRLEARNGPVVISKGP